MPHLPTARDVRGLIVVAVLGMVMLAPAPAHALDWTSQRYQQVSQAQTNADQARVGADAQGNAVLAWREDSGSKQRIRVATRAPGGYFARVEFPGGGFASSEMSDASPPRVAVAADGSAVVAWDRLASVNMTNQRVVEAIFRSGLGAWSSVEQVARGSAPDVAIDPQGTVTLAWNDNYTIQARTRTAAGAYGQSATVYTQSQAQAEALLFEPHVAVDGAGNAIVAWADAPTSTPSDRFPREVRAAQRSAGGTWETDKVLTTRLPYENIVVPVDVAISNGTAAVMVARYGPVNEAYVRPAGQPDYAVHKFYEYGSYGTESGGLAFDAGGNALAVFAFRDKDDAKSVASAYRPAGGDWGAITQIAGTSDRFRVSEPAADAAGNFTMVWAAGLDGGEQKLYASTRPAGAGSTFDTPQIVSEPRPNGQPGGPIETPYLTVSGQGQAIASWSHTDGNALRVEAGFGIPPGSAPPPVMLAPPPPQPPNPSAITLGRSLASGKATILSVAVGGDVDRLEWKVANAPAVIGRVVDGRLQESIRLRTPAGQWKATVTATGPGGTKSFTRVFTSPRRPTDAAAEKVKISSGAADVIAVGSQTVLSGVAGICGQLTIYAKTQHYSGCFKPIDDISDIPAAERGVLVPLARAVDVSPSDAVAVSRAVELTDGYVGSTMRINDRWPVVPRGSAKLVSYPQAKVLASSDAALQIGGRQLAPASDSGFFLTLDPATGARVDLGSIPVPAGLTVGGFTLRSLTVVLGTVTANMRADMRLPSFITPGLGLDFDVIQPVRFTATPDEFSGLDGLTVGPISAIVALMPMTNLKLTYSQASGTWTGGGTACLLGALRCIGSNPCKADVPCIDLTPPYGGLRFRGGKLEYMGVTQAFTPPGRIVAPGAFLERLDVGIKEDPVRLVGAARIGVGPLVKVDGKAVIAFPSNRAPWFPSRDEVGNLPPKLYSTPFTNVAVAASADVILPLPVIGETRLGGGYLLYEFPGYVAAGGGADFSIGPVHMTGTISGEYDVPSQTYNLHGDIRACLGTKVCSGAIGNVSRGPNNAGGAGACISVGPVNVGGGYQWARALPLVWPLDGCKWSRFKLDVKKSAHAAQADGATTIEVTPGATSVAYQLTGAGGAPRVRVSGPSGSLESSDNGLDYTADGKIRIIRLEEADATMTVVGLQDVKPGSYKIELLPGSVPITEVMTAANPPNAKVTAKVSGSGAKRTLAYQVMAREGQSVTFLDVTGGGAGKKLRTVTGGKGKVTWSPSPGRAVHRVVARFELDGIPAEERMVASFKPPPPTLGKVTRLVVRRGKKSTLLVSWRRVRDATRYQVTVATSSGKTVSKLVTSTKVRLNGIPTSASGKVAVVGLAVQRQGKAATKPFKRTSRAPTKFGDLKKCKVVKKKKLVCH